MGRKGKRRQCLAYCPEQMSSQWFHLRTGGSADGAQGGRGTKSKSLALVALDMLSVRYQHCWHMEKKKQQEKCWTCKWHSKEKSELEMDIQESMATGWQIKLWNEWAHLMRKSRESRVSGLGCENNQHFKGYFVRQTKTWSHAIPPIPQSLDFTKRVFSFWWLPINSSVSLLLLRPFPKPSFHA